MSDVLGQFLDESFRTKEQRVLTQTMFRNNVVGFI